MKKAKKNVTRMQSARERVALARKAYLAATRQVMEAWESNEVWGKVWDAEAREEAAKRRYFNAANYLRDMLYAAGL